MTKWNPEDIKEFLNKCICCEDYVWGEVHICNDCCKEFGITREEAEQLIKTEVEIEQRNSSS